MNYERTIPKGEGLGDLQVREPRSGWGAIVKTKP